MPTKIEPTSAASELLPVIHYRDLPTTLANAEIALAANCAGVFLIHMEGNDRLLDGAIPELKARFPGLKIGVNRLSAGPAKSISRNVALEVDYTWSDTCGVTSEGLQSSAHRIQEVLASSPAHRFFASVAFKYQRPEPNPPLAAVLAMRAGFTPTTSGSATGSAPSVEKISAMATALPEKVLAVASGITPENVNEFVPFVRYFLVSTGISKTFHEFDEHLVRALAEKINHPAE